MPRFQSTVDRFFSYVSKDPDTGCWNWTGHKTLGYGGFYYDGDTRRAHRFAFITFVRPLRDGEILHHKCENKGCVNPDHLQATTNQTHLVELHPNNLFYKKAHQTHCDRGHPLTPDNLVPDRMKKGERVCATCYRVVKARYEQLHHAERLAKALERQRKNYAEKKNDPELLAKYNARKKSEMAKRREKDEAAFKAANAARARAFRARKRAERG